MTQSSSNHVWCSHTCSLISSSSSWARCILWAMRLCSWPRGCTEALPVASSSVGQRCRAERNSERIIAGLRKANIKVVLCSWFMGVEFMNRTSPTRNWALWLCRDIPGTEDLIHRGAATSALHTEPLPWLWRLRLSLKDLNENMQFKFAGCISVSVVNGKRPGYLLVLHWQTGRD